MQLEGALRSEIAVFRFALYPLLFWESPFARLTRNLPADSHLWVWEVCATLDAYGVTSADDVPLSDL